LPSRLCSADIVAGRLTELLPEWSFRTVNLNLLYPSSRLIPSKVRAFIDFAMEQFRERGMDELIYPSTE